MPLCLLRLGVCVFASALHRQLEEKDETISRYQYRARAERMLAMDATSKFPRQPCYNLRFDNINMTG
jgi:hypothetical protein